MPENARKYQKVSEYAGICQNVLKNAGRIMQ